MRHFLNAVSSGALVVAAIYFAVCLGVIVLSILSKLFGDLAATIGMFVVGFIFLSYMIGDVMIETKKLNKNG